MFVELKPLLANRSLTITVAMLSSQQIRVNVVPSSSPEDKKANEKISYSHKEVAAIPEEAIKALTTPVSITGTAEEIDANLATALSKYVESHTQLQESFSRAGAEIADAVKAIDERNKAKKEKEKASRKDEKKQTNEVPEEPENRLPLFLANEPVVSGGSPQPAGTSNVPAEQPTLLNQPRR